MALAVPTRHDASVGLFKRSETVGAKKIAAHARYVDDDVHRVDLKVTSTDGETATIDLSLDPERDADRVADQIDAIAGAECVEDL